MVLPLIQRPDRGEGLRTGRMWGAEAPRKGFFAAPTGSPVWRASQGGWDDFAPLSPPGRGLG